MTSVCTTGNIKNIFRFIHIIVFLLCTALHVQAAQSGKGIRTFHASELWIDASYTFAKTLSSNYFGKTSFYALQTNAITNLRSASHVIIQSISLPDARVIHIDATEFSIFTDDAKIIEATSIGSIRRSLPDITLYKGTVQNEKSSFVYLAIDKRNISGTIRMHDVEYSINTMVSQSITQPQTIIQIAEVISSLQPSSCGVTDVDERAILSVDPSFTKERKIKNILQDTLLAKVAIDADYEAFQHFGGVTQAENYITARMGECSAIYERDIAIKLQISFLRVWSTSSDPYTSTTMNSALAEFQSYWAANMDTVDRALAVFCSRRTLTEYTDPSVTAGLASLDALCSKARGYAFDRLSANNNFISGNTGVMAHEMGHVFGSRHTHSCWWNPPLDSCSGPEDGTCFSGNHQVNGEVMSYCGQKTNEFRARVAAYVRQRAQAAKCLTITSQIRSLILNSPIGGESWCQGTSHQFNWISTGVTYVKIELSSDGGNTFGTVLIDQTSAPDKAWTWSIPPAQQTGKQYRIRITDALVGSPVAVMTSNFEIKPGTIIQQQPQGKTICEANDIRLSTTATGAGTLTYQWKKDGVVLPGKTSSSLYLQQVTKQDSGTYVVVITGECGILTSNTALVNVKKAPVITQQPKDLIGCIGKPVTISMGIIGDNLSFVWYKGTDLVQGQSKSYITFPNVTANDQGGYFCQISSACGGTMSNVAYLTIGTPVVTMMSPIGNEQFNTSDSCTIRFNAPCIDKVKIEFSTNSGQTWTLLITDYDPISGTYKFKLPTSPTNNARIRVTDTSNGTLFSMSQDFKIVTKTSVQNPKSEPTAFTLSQNYPNPFGEATLSGDRNTTIRFSIPNVKTFYAASLRIYDLLGRTITTLFEGTLESGDHSFDFNAYHLSSGVYMYKLTINGISQSRIMVLK